MILLKDDLQNTQKLLQAEQKWSQGLEQKLLEESKIISGIQPEIQVSNDELKAEAAKKTAKELAVDAMQPA